MPRMINKMPGAIGAMGVGGGDINNALQSMRSAVGYNPAMRKPMMQPGIGGAAGPVGIDKPMGMPVAADSPPSPWLEAGGLPPVRQPFEPQALGIEPQALVGIDPAGPLAASDELIKQGVGDIGGGFAAQKPLVGAGGNIQAAGPGRFGGNPPPNVLARRGGVFRGGGAMNPGIMDRRKLLNDRMRARISGVPQLGGGSLGFDPSSTF